MQDQDPNSEPRRALRPPLPQTGELSSHRPQVSSDSIDEPVSPEMLVPRLGDFLLEMGVIRPDQLQHALDYQRANSIAGNPRMIGQVLVELGYITREQLDKVVTEQIMALQSALKDSNHKLERHVQQRTGALEWRLIQIRTAAEVAQRAISATNLEDLLKITVKLIVERFGYYHAALFLLDDNNKYAVLREATGSIGQELKNRGYRITVGSQSIIGWVTEHKQTRVASDVKSDPLYLQDELLPQTRSEACIPLMIDQEIVGALDVQSRDSHAFNSDDVAVLQTLANQIASSIKTLRLLELTQVNLQEVSLMYSASSKIAKSNSSTEVLRIVSSTLEKTPYITAVIFESRTGYRILSMSNPDDPGSTREYTNRPVNLASADLDGCFRDDRVYVSLAQQREQIPSGLLELAGKLSCQDAVYLPIRQSGKITSIWFLGSRSINRFNNAILQPYIALAEFTSTTLSKIEALDNAQQQLKRLQILNSVGQVISTEIELSSVFQSVHRQITQLFGDIGFYLALYDTHSDTISFPYLWEGGELLQLDPIPLGEGLTSIVIRSRQPLLLVDDTENRARELGARSVGQLAKSWLGVPLIIGDEILGVLTVQDIEREYAFDEEDSRLLTTLASQVAVAIRNARLIGSIRKQADQQRLLFELTEKIRRSVDMDTILATTASELGKVLGARRAQIDIRIGESRHDIHPDNGKEVEA
jgi:GAF domain-containing protein